MCLEGSSAEDIEDINSELYDDIGIIIPRIIISIKCLLYFEWL